MVPIAQQLLVSLGHPKYTGARSKYKSRFGFYWIILATLVFINSWFRSQHSRLADLPHLAAKVVKKAHDATCAQAHQQDSALP